MRLLGLDCVRRPRSLLGSLKRLIGQFGAADPGPIFRSVFCFEADLVSAKEGYTELCSFPKKVVEIQKFYCHLYVSLSVSGGTWLKIILENMVQWCDVEARQSRDQEEMVQKEDLVAQLLQLVVWTTKCYRNYSSGLSRWFLFLTLTTVRRNLYISWWHRKKNTMIVLAGLA